MGGAATSRRVVLAVTLALLVLAVVVGRLWYVHHRTWERSVVASAIPPKVQFADRTHLRGSDEVAPAQAVEVGRTLGGGVILSDSSQRPDRRLGARGDPYDRVLPLRRPLAPARPPRPLSPHPDRQLVLE